MKVPNSVNERFMSVDLFRGIVMFLLLAEHAGLYYVLTYASPENHVFSKFVKQFFHHEWHGMYFWDLIQPYFTFVIGIAMAFSINKRWQMGEKWWQTFRHIAVRCAVLFILGLILRCCAQKKLVWELWDVLTLFSLNIFITFLIFRFRDSTKLAFSFVLLLVTEILYRVFAADGFDQPFVRDYNFGAYLDLVLMGKTHHSGWVFINFLPTTAHAIWGVITGNLLLGQQKNTEKYRTLILAGLTGIVIGYGLDLLNISPINKHLSTSSFVIVSGGWCLVTYGLLYWCVDIKGYRKWTAFFTIVGMNPIFIYVFSRTVGKYWLYEIMPVFTRGFMNYVIVSEGIINLATILAILFFEWCLCYWLYKKKIFIKI